MNLGALVGFYEDMKERRDTVRRITTPEMGFAETADGVWTWTFTQNELTQAVEAPSGTAVEIAGVLGFPFIRLRAALPEEMFEGSVSQCLGRQAGLSIAGLAGARDDNLHVAQTLRKGMTCFACGQAPVEQIPELRLSSYNDDGDDTGKPGDMVPPRSVKLVSVGKSVSPSSSRAALADYDPSMSAEGPSPQTIVGTAIIFAYMTNQKTLPVYELAKRREAASNYFRDARVPGIDHDFDELVSMARACWPARFAAAYLSTDLRRSRLANSSW